MVAARQDGAVRRHEGTRRAEREERVSQGLLLAPELCRAGSTVTLPGIAHLSSGTALGRARPPAGTRAAWGGGGTEGWWHGGDGGTPGLRAGWPQEPVRAPLGADPGFTCRDHSCTERVGARSALPCLSLYSKGQERPGAGWECHLPSREAAPSATCPRGPALPPRCPHSRTGPDGTAEPRGGERQSTVTLSLPGRRGTRRNAERTKSTQGGTSGASDHQDQPRAPSAHGAAPAGL